MAVLGAALVMPKMIFLALSLVRFGALWCTEVDVCGIGGSLCVLRRCLGATAHSTLQKMALQDELIVLRAMGFLMIFGVHRWCLM